MKLVKSLVLCLFLASSFSYGEQVLRIMESENLTAEEKAIALTAGHAVLEYLESTERHAIRHPLVAADDFKGIKIVQPYGNTSEIGKMKGIYEVPSVAKKAWGNEDIGVKWRGNLPAFADTRTAIGIRNALENRGTVKLVIREMNGDGQIDALQEESYNLYKATDLLAGESFKRRGEIKYSSPFGEAPNFNVFTSSYGLGEKVVEMKIGGYGYEEYMRGEKGVVSAAFNGEIDEIEPKTIYLQFSSEPLGGGGGAPPRKDNLSSYSLNNEIGEFEPQTTYLQLSSEPLGGGGGAPRKSNLAAFVSHEELLETAGYGNSVQVKIYAGYSFDELESEAEALGLDDGSAVLLITPFQNY